MYAKILAHVCDHVQQFYGNCQILALWQQLEFASELESDLQDTVDWGKKWLVNFSAGKTQLVLFAWSNKMDGSVLEKKIIF